MGFMIILQIVGSLQDTILNLQIYNVFIGIQEELNDIWKKKINV